MKKVIQSSLFIVAFLLFENTQAQTEKGSWMLSGSSNLGFLSLDTDPDETTNFSINANPGYFIAENLVVGLDLIYQRTETGSFKSTSSGIGPWARYYVNGNIFFGAAYSARKIKSEGGAFPSDNTGGFLEIEAGYAHFFNEHVAIEPALNYLKGSGDFDNRSIGLIVALSFYF